MVNLIRKALLINLITLTITGKLLLLYFNKITMGIKYLPISHDNINCKKKYYNPNEFIEFYNQIKSNKTYYELVKDTSYIEKFTNKCEIINKVYSINRFNISIRNYKLKIFISIILIIISLNYIIIKYIMFKNKKHINERLNIITKNKSIYVENVVSYDKKNN